MINIPNTNEKRISQVNSSDLFGNTFITKNITLDDEGYIKLSNSPRRIMHNDIDGDFDTPVAIEYGYEFDTGSGVYETKYMVQTTDDPFWVDSEPMTQYPVQIADSGFPVGDGDADICWIGADMAISESADLTFYDPAAHTFTDTDISPGSGIHPVLRVLNINAMAVAEDVYTMKTYELPIDGTPTLIATLTLPEQYQITSACYYNDRVYIGTKNKYGIENTYMFVWDGVSSGYISAYQIDSPTIFSMCTHQNNVFLTTGTGGLYRFNGSGFTLAANFPRFNTLQQMVSPHSSGNYVLSKNTMRSTGKRLYINYADGLNYQTRLLNQPDGIWCYDDRIGLYHRYSNSISQIKIETIGTGSVATATNIITVAASPITGTEVFYQANGGTAIAGLTDNEKYFVIKVGATEIKLATTLSNATAGTAIDLTGTGNAAQTLMYCPNIDYGSFFSSEASALCLINIPEKLPQYGVDVLFASEAVSRTNTSQGDKGSLVTVSSNLESRGYFITPKINSSNVTDSFETVSIKYQPLVNDFDKIILKYRTSDDNKISINTTNWVATWASTTTFTTTQTDIANAKVGDEVEFLRGAAAGLLTHIVSVSAPAAGVYTVTITEGFDNYAAGDKSVFIYRNWKKLHTITKDETNGYTQLELGNQINGKFIQFKVELRGIGIKIEELSVDNIKYLPK